MLKLVIRSQKADLGVVDARGASEGILIFWDNRVLDLPELKCGGFTISSSFRNVEDGFVWVFTGDFNSVRFPRERRKEVNLMAKMRRFYEVIEELRLKDLLLSDCAFQCALPKIVSDHYPITLEGGGVKRGKILFRFENMWLLSNGFKELVRKWWTEYLVIRNSSHCLDETLKALKKDLIGAEELKDFRLINLVGGLYKLFAKVLANRLKSAMQKLVSDSQQAIIQGRHILDAALISNEAMDSRLKVNIPGLLLKLDIEKFESISDLKVNRNKSEVITIGRLESWEDVASAMGYRVGKLSTSYLGLPLGFKDEWVSNSWEGSGELGCWNPHFLMHFNDWELEKVEGLFLKRHPLWVLHSSIKRNLLNWHDVFVGKKREKAWRAALLCLMWTLWKERNERAFNDIEQGACEDECRRTKGQRVLPIFYKIDPSDVGNQRGKFGEALAKHEKNLENREMVRIWRDALTQVANLSVVGIQGIGALIELIDPDDDAIVRDLTQLASEISALMKLIGPLDDAVVKLIRYLREQTKGFNGAWRKFEIPIRAGFLGLTRSTTIKARLRAKQVLIVLHYVNDSVVSNYANASILILILDSWNLLYVLLLQSCEDVFHGSPATIFCESKLSDLRSCEVGRIGNPLNWGDGVVRKVVLAEVVGEEAGKGKTLRMEDFEDI
ncbi:hypothetical protein CK203_089517 [Vitis vinifera]|uniref:TIR domain-containing protein n=1 Tax=Vitis vinifera TaxID=29760 RepID=A0A438FJ42_VITVI|nr:hypothetical protein CK203_089517 [Vitis vinifera]